MKILLLLVVVFQLMACSEKPVPLEKIHGYTMGTSYTVQWPRVEKDNLPQVIQTETTQVLKDINQQMSTYQTDSELSVFNAMSAPAKMPISVELHEVLELSLALHDLTQGYFDVSVGPVVNLWGFGPDKAPEQLPTKEQTALAQASIGLDVVTLNADSIEKSAQRYLDLSAIAKGYAVDKVAEILESHGIANYLVEIGGEMRVKGSKPAGLPWRVAVERPDEYERNVQKIFEITDAAMATSGDYRNYFEKDGVHYSHTIDPFTAKPVKHSLASVTIIDDTCARADALATAMLVMGADKAKAFSEEHKIKAYLIERTVEGFTEYSSSAFKRWQQM